uniref:Uncharacterized protein n=1 Tax=Arundo donax TaxID=35708 RepID=A0A0A9CXL7_ARUDO
MAAAASAATSDPGDFLLICVSGLFSVIVSGLSQQLWSRSGSPT